jgi:hypothetical protein
MKRNTSANRSDSGSPAALVTRWHREKGRAGRPTEVNHTAENPASRNACRSQIPRPIRMGRTPLWPYEELRAWVAAGCPDRLTCQAARDE